MPRTTRAVAQRLGTKQKSRRRAQRQAPETPASVERILDEVAPIDAGEAGVATADAAPAAPMRASAGVLPRRGTPSSGRGTSRVATTRRRYVEYAAEYAYVWADLRRVILVAGALLVLLIVLSFFIG
jgi:hypothetical protein